jgi:hypothetical protein
MAKHAPYGLLISALGAAVLALSVFAPWYGVSITANGADAARAELVAVARQYGNTTFQARANQVGAEFKALEGRQIATVSAHEILKRESWILLLLAGVALLASLLRLVNARGRLAAHGSQISLLGTAASLVVIIRMVFRPDLPVDFISLSLNWGIWLALLSSAAVFFGGASAESSRAYLHPRPKVGPGPPQFRHPPSP